MLSNVTVAVTTGMLAADPDRRSTLFRVLRLDGVLAIAVTGVVFHLALSDLQELTGWNAFADFVLHTLSPILAVAGWVLFGPRGHLSPRVVALSVVAPVLWLAYTLVRGTLVQDRFGDDYYPYPFMDVQEHGYPVVLVNCAVVAVLFLALAYGALLLDRRLRRGGAGAPAPQTPPA
ncbi:Pr6Pr family membrane protein [Miltoncostaea oceani]|uniref:Pr6Pr family membrane protein n=1 Tax=Miltoncostaea oceani TaxID=2843216 RepID=UPI001C3E3F23